MSPLRVFLFRFYSVTNFIPTNPINVTRGVIKYEKLLSFSKMLLDFVFRHMTVDVIPFFFVRNTRDMSKYVETFLVWVRLIVDNQTYTTHALRVEVRVAFRRLSLQTNRRQTLWVTKLCKIRENWVLCA